jgi:hypothetical protein
MTESNHVGRSDPKPPAGSEVNEGQRAEIGDDFEDDALVVKVRRVIAQYPGVDVFDLRVIVNEGNVLVDGCVEDADQLIKLNQLLTGIDPESRIQNRVLVAGFDPKRDSDDKPGSVHGSIVVCT